jgi:hypothetical protein
LHELSDIRWRILPLVSILRQTVEAFFETHQRQGVQGAVVQETSAKGIPLRGFRGLPKKEKAVE